MIKIPNNAQIAAAKKDEANTDYQKYLEWIAEGNTIEPAD